VFVFEHAPLVIPDPDRAIGRGFERRGAARGRAVGGAQFAKVAVATDEEAVALAPQPELAFGIGAEGGEDLTGKLGDLVAVNDVETLAIEACEAAEGREPKVSVGGLGHGDDGVLRQSVSALPGVDEKFSLGAGQIRGHQTDWLPVKQKHCCEHRNGELARPAAHAGIVQGLRACFKPPHRQNLALTEVIAASEHNQRGPPGPRNRRILIYLTWLKRSATALLVVMAMENMLPAAMGSES
jgi:hypothetical protein